MEGKESIEEIILTLNCMQQIGLEQIFKKRIIVSHEIGGDLEADYILIPGVNEEIRTTVYNYRFAVFPKDGIDNTNDLNNFVRVVLSQIKGIRGREGLTYARIDENTICVEFPWVNYQSYVSSLDLLQRRFGVKKTNEGEESGDLNLGETNVKIDNVLSLSFLPNSKFVGSLERLGFDHGYSLAELNNIDPTFKLNSFMFSSKTL